MSLSNVHKISELPEEYSILSTYINELDNCFKRGFSGLGMKKIDILNKFLTIFTGSPLESKIRETIEDFQQNMFKTQHFTLLAGIRQSLNSLSYVILRNHLKSILNKGKEDLEQPLELYEIGKKSDEIQALYESIQEWLMELALTGFERLTSPFLEPFQVILDKCLQSTEIVDLNSLLLGFYNELINLVPFTDLDNRPTTRWGDLWSRVMLKSSNFILSTNTKQVTGDFFPVGTQLYYHDNFVNFVVYGILKVEKNQKLTKINLSSFKVDIIPIEEIWLLFQEYKVIFEALHFIKSLKLKNAEYLSSGGIIFSKETISLGANFQVSKMLENLNTEEFHPFDRHPIHVFEPVLLKDYSIKKKDGSLNIEIGKQQFLTIVISAETKEFNTKHIKKSDHIFGFIRFNWDHWIFEPITVFKNNSDPLFHGKSAIEVLENPPKKNSVVQLKERSTRLLRTKG